MPGSKSSKKLKRRKPLPRPNKIPEPTLPSSISSEDKPFKLPKKKRIDAKLKQVKLKFKKPKTPKPPRAPRQYNKSERVKSSRPRKPRAERMSKRDAYIQLRLKQGYPIEFATLYPKQFERMSPMWRLAKGHEKEELAARQLVSINHPMFYWDMVQYERYKNNKIAYEKPHQLADRMQRIQEFYTLHPETRIPSISEYKIPIESEDTEVFTDTKAQTVEKEVEKAETKAQKASDSSTEATPANLTKVRDDLYLSKDRVYRIARKNNKWKVQKLNKSRNIYEFLFYTSTLKEAAEKIATA